MTTDDILVTCDRAEADGALAHLTDDQRASLDRARAAMMAGDHGSAHTISLILDRVIKIPVYRWEQVSREFTRLVIKAEARGLPIPVLREVARDDRHVFAHVLGGAPVFDGWRFVAVLEGRTLEDGTRVNTVRTVPGEECPTEYRDRPEHCDHCGLRRIRNQTFVLSHVDGRMIQVGSTCLDEYLGAEALSAWLTLGAIGTAADGWALEVWDDDAFARYGQRSAWSSDVDVLTFLAAVVAEVRSFGFASARSALDPSMATGRSVWWALQEQDHTPVTEDDMARAREIVAFGQALAGESDWAHNVRTVLGEGQVRKVDANTVAALVPRFLAAGSVLDEHLPGAVVGEKVIATLACVGKSSWYAEFYGVWKYRLNFRDGDGRQVTWVTTSPFASEREIEPGNSYRVVAKVKELGRHQDVAQTEITRPSIALEGEETKAMKAAARKVAKALGAAVPAWAATDRKKSEIFSGRPE